MVLEKIEQLSMDPKLFGMQAGGAIAAVMSNSVMDVGNPNQPRMVT